MMINFFHQSSPGFAYFSSLIQELKQVGLLVYDNENIISSELKNLVRLNKKDFYLVVAADDYGKQLSILARNLFEDVMSTNKYHRAALRTDQDVLSAHQQKDVLNLKEIVPSREYNLLCKLFASQFVDHLDINQLQYKNNVFIHCELQQDGPTRKVEYILHLKS